MLRSRWQSLEGDVESINSIQILRLVHRIVQLTSANTANNTVCRPFNQQLLANFSIFRRSMNLIRNAKYECNKHET